MHDVAIVGGGLAGTAAALTLAQQGANVGLIERQPAAVMAAEDLDGRTTAIAAGARAMLERLGLWQTLEPQSEPIWDIRVSDRQSLLHLHFAHQNVGDQPMGHIVENFRLRRALLDAVEQEPKIACYWETELESFESEDDCASLVLKGGQVVSAPLAVAADGRGSSLRRFAGIGVRALDYRQSGIVCVVAHEFPHNGVAHERFLDGGPFAILPMIADAEGRHRSSIVWTEPRMLAERLVSLPADDLLKELSVRFGDFLGRLEITSECTLFPFSLTIAQRLTKPRLVLLGEAGHGIHPIAGQGFNVSIRDIECLAALAGEALEMGHDLGERAMLSRYAKQRWPDILAMAAATDVLNRLFLSNLPPLAVGRRIGMAAINRLPMVKRQFQRHAMGVSLFPRPF